MQEVYVYPRLQHRRIRPLRALLFLLPGVLALWLFASPVAMADDPIGDAVGSATDTATSTSDAVDNSVGSTTDTVGDTVGSATDTVNNTVGSTTNTVGSTAGSTTNTVGNTVGSTTNTVGSTAGSATNTVGNTVGSATNTVGKATGSLGQTAADVSGSLMPSLAGQAPTPLALTRERHAPQMCIYLPSSFLSELALVPLALDGGSLSGTGSGSSSGSSGGGPFGFLGPNVPTVPIPGLGDVPVGAIVALLAMMVLAIIVAKAWVNQRPRQPAFLPVSGISRAAEPRKRRAL
jgi:hypothetical protein